MESVLGGTLAPLENRFLSLQRRQHLLECINTQKRDFGQVETGLNFLSSIMPLRLPF